MNNSISSRFEKLMIVGLDILMVNMGFLLSYHLFAIFQKTTQEIRMDPMSVLFLTLGICLSFYLFDLYEDWRRRRAVQLLVSIMLAIMLYTVSSLLLSFFISTYINSGILLTASTLQVTLLLAARLSLWHFMKKTFGEKKVLIVSKKNEDGKFLEEKFQNHHKGWFTILGSFTYQSKGFIRKNLHQADVVVLSPELDKESAAQITSLCMKNGKEILMVPQSFELAIFDAKPQHVDDMLVFSMKAPKLSGMQQVIKRILDVVMSMILLISCSPIMLLLYFFIPITSKGPAFFKQERIGINGKPFLILKFRSMVQDAEEKTGPVLAAEKDPRITPLGGFLRAVRLDELPQLLNVLKGDMSLIGPRPERSFFINQFSKTIPDYNLRFSVKPGITGLAQVFGNYTTSVEDKLRYDLMYVRRYTIALDMKILMQTLRVVLQRDQAKGVVETNVKEKRNYRSVTVAKNN